MKAQHGHHVTPKKTLFTVFGALVTLTILTALTAQIDLGGFNVPLALTIACAKAGLVVAFFMALKYDNRVNALVFSLGVIFVIVFLTFTLLDTAFRGDLGNVGSETISDMERREAVLRGQESGAAAEMSPSGEASDAPAAEPSSAGASDSTASGAAPSDSTASGAAPSGAAASGEGAAE